MAFSLQEKRQFPRISVHAPIRYQIRGQGEFENLTCDNLSTGGACLISDKMLPPATTLMIEIQLLSRVFKAIGRIVWANSLAHSYNTQLGVQFIEVDPKEGKFLKDFVNMKLSNNQTGKEQ
ncbi:MAG: PilZ domain-containing protein [Candidatus Omnitrophica bacterium]|nr:PilZ domain-containing protein [Candidatus Omnitrophota bacterium]